MKTTIAKAVSGYRILNEAKLSKMESGEQIALVKNLRPLRRVYEEYDSFIKESVKKLAPENWEEIQKPLQGLEDLRGDELKAKLALPEVKEAVKARDEYNAKIIQLDRDESAKETELDISPMEDETLGRLFAGNDFNASQLLELADLLGKQ